LPELETEAVEAAPDEYITVRLTRAQARVLLDLLGGEEKQ
jgi:hypothetical protein